MKFWLVLLTACLFYGCASTQASGPAIVPVPNCCSVTLGSDFATFVVETFDDDTGNFSLDLHLPEPITVDSLQGWVSYYGLNGRCSDDNTAVVGQLQSDAGSLAVWDIQSRGNLPVNLPISVSYPHGVKITKLWVQMFDDLCHPSDFRVTATLHRNKTETGTKWASSEGNFIQ